MAELGGADILPLPGNGASDMGDPKQPGTGQTQRPPFEQAQPTHTAGSINKWVQATGSTNRWEQANRMQEDWGLRTAADASRVQGIPPQWRPPQTER